MRKKTRSRLILLAISFLSVSLLCAFLLWLFWSDFKRSAAPTKKKPPSKTISRPAQEGISEEDRKKLKEVLEQK